MSEQLAVYEVGEQFVTVDTKGCARIYKVSEDGCAYVRGFMPEHLTKEEK